MGDFFRMEQVHVKNLAIVLSESNVTGIDAHKVVAIGEILASKGTIKKSGVYFKFDIDLVNFIRKTLDQIMIKGAFALQIVQLQLIFRDGLNAIPDDPDLGKATAGPPAP